MDFTLRVWRQADPKAKGRFQTYQAKDVSPDTSFLEMLDLINERLVTEGSEPIAFDSDCREGICGTCCLVINGHPHGRLHGCTICELRMRHFQDRETLSIEPIRARAFPIIKDLIVDRSALDRIIQAGGYVSINTGSAPEAASIPVTKERAERAMDAAACIGCGACVASCKNAAAMLFTSARISHLALLPQGEVEWKRRAIELVRAMDKAGFGYCSNEGECEKHCPKEIKLTNIARMNRHFLLASLLENE